MQPWNLWNPDAGSAAPYLFGNPQQPPTVPGGADMMNSAFADGSVSDYQQHEAAQAQQAAAQQQNLVEMARQKAIEQDPALLNYMQREIARGIIGGKLAYEAAQRNGDAQGMAAAMEAANSLRGQAEAIGFDAGAYGSGVTLKDAVQALANNDARAVNDLLGSYKSARDYFNETYYSLVKSGASKERAMEVAGRELSAYQADMGGKLRDAFRMYGTDERGALTKRGVDIIDMMNGIGDADTAGLNAKQYASPVQQWNFLNSIDLANLQQQNALDRMGVQHQYGNEDAARDFQYGEIKADNQMERTMQLRLYAAQLGQEIKEMDYQSAVRRANDFADTAGITGEEKVQFMAQALGYAKGGKNGDGEGKVSKTTQGALQNVGDKVEVAFKAVESGDALAEDNTSVSEACNAIEDAISKGHITGGQVTEARNIEYALQYVFNVKSGNSQEAAKAGSYITPDYWEKNMKEYGKQPQ